jgi:hypothetical protein
VEILKLLSVEGQRLEGNYYLHRKLLFTQVEILKLLSVEGHPHVVRLFEFIETPTKFFMVSSNKS